MLEDEDNGASRSLVRPDMATAQTKFCPYTRSICPEIVRLPNVIASPDIYITYQRKTGLETAYVIIKLHIHLPSVFAGKTTMCERS